ncbi:MAG TPA: hypothetical protein VF447_11910 [Terriglobales bacterium]
MKPLSKPMAWPFVPVAFVALGMALVIHVALPLPDSKVIGGFLLAVGAFNVLFSRMLGSRVCAQMSDRPVLGWFWLRCGEKGSQLLFLGIAATLVVAGCFLLIFGTT